MAVVDDVREALGQTVPDFSDRSGDWARVLAIARAGEGDRQGRAGASQSRRRRRLIALAAAVLVVVVGTASAFGTVRGIFGEGQRHVEISIFECSGRKGDLTLHLLFPNVGPRAWKVVHGTGQYSRITGGGRIPQVGGRGRAHSARLVGFLSRPGAAKQQVAITIKGRPNGVFVLTPLQAGVLRRDSGTQSFSGSMG